MNGTNNPTATTTDIIRRTERSSSITSSTSTATGTHIPLPGTSPSKDSFLNYFFGGASRTDRPALGHIERQQQHQEQTFTNNIEGELESHFGNNVRIYLPLIKTIS